MKYIITENQNERLRMLMSELLENEFAKNNVVCEIKVFNVDDGVFNYKIHVFYNERYEKHGAFYQFVETTKKKIHKVLSNWFNLSEDEYYISSFMNEC
jgi:hypothetical protein